MNAFLFFLHHSFILCYDSGLIFCFLESNDAIKPLLKGIVMAYYKQLIETTHAPDLFRQVCAAQFVHILRRFVKEGDIQRGELFKQRKAYRQGCAHLLATAQLSECTINTLAMQDDFVEIGRASC